MIFVFRILNEAFVTSFVEVYKKSGAIPTYEPLYIYVPKTKQSQAKELADLQKLFLTERDVHFLNGQHRIVAVRECALAKQLDKCKLFGSSLAVLRVCIRGRFKLIVLNVGYADAMWLASFLDMNHNRVVCL